MEDKKEELEIISYNSLSERLNKIKDGELLIINCPQSTNLFVACISSFDGVQSPDG